MYGAHKKGTVEKGTKKAKKQVSRAKGSQVLIYESKEIGFILKIYDIENILIVDAAGFRTEVAAMQFAESYI